MNGKNLYVLGALVIITGVLGAVFGIIFGTPGSVIIGSGLALSAVWMLHQLHAQENSPVDREGNRL